MTPTGRGSIGRGSTGTGSTGTGSIGGFRKVGERSVYDGKTISLAVGTFESPDGSTFEREIVHHPGAVGVVPVLDDGETVVLVRQYRGPIESLLLEIPAGKLDVEGEALDAAAARELEEEIGQRAASLERLGAFYNSAGFCDEHTTLYLATGLTETATSAQGVEEDHMTIEHVALRDVSSMVADGRLADPKTIIGLTLASERLDAGAGKSGD